MFYYLSGKLALLQPSFAVIDCGGVGYKCTITMNTYKALSGKENVKLYTHLNVREDALDLFGFGDEQELHFFTLLISISGVGPKVAVSILSELQPDAFANCVITSDVKRLTKAHGVGTKLAQRICLELKDKMAKTKAGDGDEMSDDGQPGSVSDAVAVLMALGYSKSDSEKAVLHCSADETNAIVKQALRLLARNL